MSALSAGFRLLFKLIFLLLAIIIIAPIGLFFIFDANDFKNEINDTLSKQTGYPIVINGKIKTNYWPWLGFDVENVQIASNDGNTQAPMASANSIALKVPAQKLLQLKFEIDTLSIHDLKLNLSKNKSGQFNWEQKRQTTPNNAGETNATQNVESDKPQKNKKKLEFSLNKIELKNCAIVYQDQKENTQYQINDLNLVSNSFAGEQAKVDAKLNIRFTDKDNSSNNWNADIKGVGDLDFAQLGKMVIQTNRIRVNYTKENKNTLAAELSGKLLITPEQLDASNLTLSTMGTTVTGWAKVPLATSKDIHFELHTKKLVLQQFLRLAQLEQSQVNTFDDNNTPRIVLTRSNATTERNAKGNVTIEHLIYNKLDLHQVVANTTLSESGVSLHPVTANGYGGKLRANVKQSFAPGSPTYIDGQYEKIQIENLLKDLYNNQKVSGRLDAKFNINVHPKNGLNGTMNSKIYNGVLHGVDVRYYFGMADSLIRKKPNSESDTKQTPFGNLNATFIARNNILTNNDLHLTSNDFYAKGAGTINLNNQTLQYKIKARRHKDNSNNLPLAITVSGPIQNPNVQPDMDEYVKAIIERELKGQIEDQIGKKLGIDSDKGTDPGDIIDDKINKEINKGLKKLFKF